MDGIWKIPSLSISANSGNHNMSMWTYVDIKIKTRDPWILIDGRAPSDCLRWCSREELDVLINKLGISSKEIPRVLHEVNVPTGQEGSVAVVINNSRSRISTLRFYGNLREAYRTPDQIIEWTKGLCSKMDQECLSSVNINVNCDGWWYECKWTKKTGWKNAKRKEDSDQPC